MIQDVRLCYDGSYAPRRMAEGERSSEARAMKIGRIVVGITPGHESDAALTRALGLGRAFDAHVDAVHGVGAGSIRRGVGGAAQWVDHVAALTRQARSSCHGKLEVLVDDPVYAELPPEDFLHVRSEKGAAALLAQAEEQGADLIVIGDHRRRGLFDFGRTARGVLAGADCPVWIQPRGPEGSQPSPIQRVLAAVDLSEGTNDVLSAAASLAGRLDVPLEVVHVFVPPVFAYDVETGVAAGPSFVIDEVRTAERRELERLCAEFDWEGLEPAVRQVEGEAVETIADRADDGALLVIGTHEASTLQRAVLGSVAYASVKDRSGPSLIVPVRAAR